MMAPPVTITLPPITVPAVTLNAPPPALVSRRNADHVGMTGDELVRVLRAMRADPRPEFRDAVIVYGKSFRAAPPAAIVAYLRAGAVVADDDESGDDVLASVGYQRTQPRAKVQR
jgi:hypothetical protein